MQAGVEVADDLAGLDVPALAEVLGVQPFEQQRPPVRVGPEQADGAVPLPVLEREVLVLGGAEPEDRRTAARRPHRDDARRLAVRRELPLLEDLRQQLAHYFLVLSVGCVVESAATNASGGTSTVPMFFIRFLPAFCFSSSLRLRLMSPP